MERKNGALIVLFCLLLCLCTGCGGSSAKILRIDIPGAVDNIDPQFATDPSARTIIRNIYEGLVIQSPDGAIHPGAAERWEISADGLRYTFTLREGLVWPDKQSTPITADDFRYALERLFYPSSPSPYAGYYTAIRGAAAVLAGEAPIDSLGITARGDTLTLSLERPDPELLGRLADPAAMPCNRAFFMECRGRYGLEKDYVLGNGPYQVSRWTDDKSIALRLSESYRSERPAVADGIDLMIGRGDPATLFSEGKSDLAPVDGETIAAFSSRGIAVLPYEKTIWCVALSDTDSVWSMVLLRQALAAGTDRSLLENVLAAPFTVSETLIPSSLLVAGEPYANYATEPHLPAYHPAAGQQHLARGLEALGLGSLPPVTLLIPDSDRHARALDYIQQGWQRDLGVYPTIERLSDEMLEKTLRSEDFGMMLVGITPPTGHLRDLLAGFRSEHRFAAYQSPFYDLLYERAASAASPKEMAGRFAEAQARLLADGALIPLYLETGGYAISKDWEDVWVYPQEGAVYIKYSLKAGG